MGCPIGFAVTTGPRLAGRVSGGCRPWRSGGFDWASCPSASIPGTPNRTGRTNNFTGSSKPTPRRPPLPRPRRSNDASRAFAASTTTSVPMKPWTRPCRRRTISPRRGRCRAACHPSTIPAMPKSAASIKMATSLGADRCWCLSPSLMKRSLLKKSTMASGPSPLPRWSSVASTNVNTEFTRLPRSLWGAPPAPLAPRPTGRTKNNDDEKAQSTVTHVAGLICYPCPRPPRPGTKDQGPRTNDLWIRPRTLP